MSRFATFAIDLDPKTRAFAVKWALRISDDNKLQFPQDESQTIMLLVAALMISAHSALNNTEVQASAKIAQMLAEHVHKEVTAAREQEAKEKAKPDGAA